MTMFSIAFSADLLIDFHAIQVFITWNGEDYGWLLVSPTAERGSKEVNNVTAKIKSEEEPMVLIPYQKY